MSTECQVEQCTDVGDVNVDVDVGKDNRVNLNDPIAARVYENILACRKE